MVCKRVILFILFCMGMFAANRAQAFLGLAWRVGLFYTTYKLIDGLSDSALSRFVDRNIDAPLDAICSFGKGVKTFGLGVRRVIIILVRQKGDSVFSEAWNGLQREYEQAVASAKQEWNGRRERVRAKKTTVERQAKELEQEQKKKKQGPRAPLHVKDRDISVVAKRKRRKGALSSGINCKRESFL